MVYTERVQDTPRQKFVRFHSQPAVDQYPHSERAILNGPFRDEATATKHKFWEMDLRPCSLGAMQKALPVIYRRYNKLRVVITKGPDLAVTAYKDEYLLNVHPRTGNLTVRRFRSLKEQIELLCQDLPTIDEREIIACLEAQDLSYDDTPH